MTLREIFQIDVDFIPDSGTLYVDLSGIRWVGRHSQSEIRENYQLWENAALRRIANLNKILRKRQGNSMSSLGGLVEIGNEVNHYRNLARMRRKVKYRVRHQGKSHKSILDFWDNELDKIRARLGREFGKLYELLWNGRESYSNNGKKIDRSEIVHFVGSFVYEKDPSKKLSFVDKSIITEAFLTGKCSGILTADNPLRECYKQGVQKFGLENCFTCDAIESRTEYL